MAETPPKMDLRIHRCRWNWCTASAENQLAVEWVEYQSTRGSTCLVCCPETGEAGTTCRGWAANWRWSHGESARLGQDVGISRWEACKGCISCSPRGPLWPTEICLNWQHWWWRPSVDNSHCSGGANWSWKFDSILHKHSGCLATSITTAGWTVGLPFANTSCKERSLSIEAFAQLLCSPGNALADPAKRSLFQDMTQPLFAYYVDTSHNTYLEGNQLSSRSSVLRYVEVLRAGCRSVEVDVWDGSNGEPVVKHGYTVTTEVLFHDVIQAIADHAFVASEYPVIISIEQHCSALQRVRQAQLMSELLGDQLLRPPWDEQGQRIDLSQHFDLSPWSARRRILVKSSIGCCERCRRPLPVYDRCVALPTRKLLQKLVEREGFDCDHVGSPCSSPRSASQEANYHWCVASGTAAKVHKLEKSIGQEALWAWTTSHLSRVYPEGTRISSGNVDPIPMWLSGVQMVAMNYQTSDKGLLLNQGLFQHYNGSCGYVLKPSTGKTSIGKAASKLWLYICCGHRLPRPDERQAAEVSSPMVSVSLHPGGQVSQTSAVNQDGYHPVFNHSVVLEISDSPLHILTFEVSWSKSAVMITISNY